MTKLLALATVCVLATASSARAECREDDSKPVSFHMEKVGGKLTMVIDTKIIICGHPPRPAVAYVTSPKTIDYAWETLGQTLLPKIIESLKQAPLGGEK